MGLYGNLAVLTKQELHTSLLLSASVALQVINMLYDACSLGETACKIRYYALGLAHEKFGV